MNNVTQFDSSRDLAPAISSAPMLDVDMIEAVSKIADVMAGGIATIPKHLQGNRSDCFAIGLQSMQWGLNPFAVAQKTHITQGGVLGYEAQLIAAVIIAKAPVTGRPEYEFIGDWSKVLGKVEEKRSEKGGKYYSASYSKADEDGLGCICRMTIIGERAPRELTVMLSQCYPRFSTQWATDPQQQITYAAIRKWSRRYAPDVILGVYTPEEREEQGGGRDMGRVDEVSHPNPTAGTAALRGKLANKRAAAGAAEAPPTADAIIAAINAATNQQELVAAIEHVSRLPNEADKLSVSAAYKAKVANEKERTRREAAAAAAAEAEAAKNPPPDDNKAWTFAEVSDLLTKSASHEALDDAADLIGQVNDATHRDELVALFQARQIELDKPAQ